MVKLRDEITEILDIQPPVFQVIEIARPIYADPKAKSVKVKKNGKTGKAHTGYYWVYYDRIDNQVVFIFDPGRGRKYPVQHLENFAGKLQTDGLGVYSEFDKLDTITLFACMAHIRRKFVDALKNWSSFVIPPNEVKPFHGTKTFTEDISLVSIYPHCHYLGKDWEIFAVTPSNDTINIIKIDEWDFNWQGAYVFERMKKIPANATIHFNATYDNTLNNPYNPSDPL